MRIGFGSGQEDRDPQNGARYRPYGAKISTYEPLNEEDMAYAPRSSRKNLRTRMEQDAEALCDTGVYKKAGMYIYISLLGNASSIPLAEGLAYCNAEI
jgi:hypothetical protein